VVIPSDLALFLPHKASSNRYFQFVFHYLALACTSAVLWGADGKRFATFQINDWNAAFVGQPVLFGTNK